MTRPSKVDRLPEEIKTEIAALRRAGHTIDQILAHLRSLGVGNEDVSRTGLHRHIVKLDELGEMIRQDRIVADALVARFGDESDDKTLRANIQMMQSLLLKLSVAARTDESGLLGPQEMMFLSAALKNLATAAKTDQSRFLEIRKELEAEKARTERIKEVVKAASKTGLGGSFVDRIRTELGIERPQAGAAP